ncbi:MAG: glycosyl transferase family 25 [Phenylobacterium sp.]|jgi:glycosyl transferase family 25
MNVDNNVDLNDFSDFKTVFPHIRCINLDQRPDRWQRCQARLDEHGVSEVERFSAVDGNDDKLPEQWTYSKGAYGCLRSHVEVVREALAKQQSHVLIFEDDVVLAADFVQQFNRYINEVPDDWDMLFLGGLHQDSPLPVSKNVVKLTRTYSTFAYALHQRVFAEFIALNQRCPVPVDVNNFQLQSEYNCYCFHPPLAWVEDSYSDISDKQSNPWWLRYGFAMRGQQIEQVLNQTLLVFPFAANHRDDPQTKALLYLLTLYSQMLRGAKIVVVEHSAEAVLTAQDMPPGAFYLPSDQPMDRGRYFAAAVAQLGEGCQVLCCLNPNIVLWNWEFRACLMLCEQYVGVIPYENQVDLNHVDSSKLLANNDYPDLSDYSDYPNQTPHQGYLFMTRSGFCQWQAAQDNMDLAQWRQSLPSNTIFNAPGTAISLQFMAIET